MDQDASAQGAPGLTAGADRTQALAQDAAATVQQTAVTPNGAGSGAADALDERDAMAGFDVDSAGYPLGAPAAPADSYVAASQSEAPAKRRARGVKAFFITFFVLAAILAGVYVGVAMMFSTQFMPNTRIGDIDASMKHDEEVAELLNAIPAQYQLDVIGDQFSMRATGEELGMTIDAQAILQAMHADQNPWYWPWYVTDTSHDETPLLKTSIDEGKADSLVKDAVGAFNKTATAPTDASIFYNEISQTFAIKAEEVGTQLDAEVVQSAVKQAAPALQPKVELGAESLKQPKVLSTDQKIVDSVDMANGLVSAHLTLTVGGEAIDEVGSETLFQFIQIDDDYNVSLSEDDLAVWVENLAASYDTVGTERTYTRADGKLVTVRGGTYGWEVDKETLRTAIMDSIKAGQEAQIEIPCVDSANLFARRGDRDWANRYIDVDLTEQHARFYGDDGSIIWEADFISGAADGKHETPQGVWYIIMKQSPSKLVGYKADGKTKDYEVDVKYWMPFQGNSVGFHDANWQPSFGGQMYAQGYGSHGCINLSTSKAKELYKLIEPNDVVVVHS